ncbi:MAG: DUF1361 domain-containing protein [Microthrixaceae bacterium]
MRPSTLVSPSWTARATSGRWWSQPCSPVRSPAPTSERSSTPLGEVGVRSARLFCLTSLPNAPYVVTDLVHLRGDVAAAAFDGVVIFGILPMYAAFIGAGFLAYLLSTQLVLREVRSVRPTVARWQVEAPLHLLCAVGVVLGRISRLNSWDVATAPMGSLERMWSTLTWQGAPFAIAIVFVAIWGTHLVVRLLTGSLLSSLSRLGAAVQGRRRPRSATTLARA